MLARVTDSPVPDAPDDFDDQTELVAGVAWTGAKSEASSARPAATRQPQPATTPQGVPYAVQQAAAQAAAQAAGEGDEGEGWGEEEATAVVSSTDIGGFFGERFRVDARLGIGAMGRVLTAVDMKTGTLVALKVLHKDRAKDTAVVERFQREAAVLREIRHPAIVRLVAFDRAKDGTWWLAMEHLVGKTLKDRLSHGGPFTPRNAWPVLAAMCDGVSLAHAKGILHRDLKPENILLLESGLPPCKILDFGLSRYTAKPDRITATGTVLGTPRYMAPEMLAEDGPIDERSDVFAIGAIAFEMFTGRSIYPADDFGQLFGCILEGRTLSLRSVRPDATRELDQVLADAVARDVEKRIRTVEELAERLARAIGVSEDRSIFLPAETGVRPARAAGAAAPRPRDTIRDAQPGVSFEPPRASPRVDVTPRAKTPPPGSLQAAQRVVAPRALTPVPAVAPAPGQQPWSGPQQLPTPSYATQQPSMQQFAIQQSAIQQPSMQQSAMQHSSQSLSNPTLGSQRPTATVSRPLYGSSFTRPEKAVRVAPASTRSTWLWALLFLVAAVVTMLGAGALAYAVRTYLVH